MDPGGLGLTLAIRGSGLLVARRQGEHGFDFDLGSWTAEPDSGAGEVQALTGLVLKYGV